MRPPSAPNDGAVSAERPVPVPRPPPPSLVYRLGRRLCVVAIWALARTRLQGLDHVPATGPLLVIANHTSIADPVVLGALFPRPVVYVTKSELFEVPILGGLLRSAGMIPVRRGQPDRRALEQALAVVAGGGVLIVFPEGTRSHDGILRRAEPGVGLLAMRSGVPVLPVGLLGTERLHHWRGWLDRPRLTLSFGPIVEAPAITTRGASRYQAVSDGLMRAVAGLLPAARRGPYASDDAGSGSFDGDVAAGESAHGV